MDIDLRDIDPDRDLDLERCRALCDDAANAQDEGPSILDRQRAHARKARARDEWEKKSQASVAAPVRPLTWPRRDGVTVLPGVGSVSQDAATIDSARARDVRESERQYRQAEHEAQRLDARGRECDADRITLQSTLDDCRCVWGNRWPGEVVERSTVHVRGASPGEAVHAFGRLS
jgi:hypothetical protein